MNYKPGWWVAYAIYCLVPIVMYIMYLSRRSKDDKVTQFSFCRKCVQPIPLFYASTFFFLIILIKMLLVLLFCHPFFYAHVLLLILLNFQETFLSRIVSFTNENPWIWMVYVVVVGLPVVAIVYTMFSTKKVLLFGFFT